LPSNPYGRIAGIAGVFQVSATTNTILAIDPICGLKISDSDRVETLRLLDKCLTELATVEDSITDAELRFVLAEVPSS